VLFTWVFQLTHSELHTACQINLSQPAGYAIHQQV
jgi:hypothetical protein